MIVCLGLIVVGIIAGIAWYLHARHYESTDDAFIDGRPVLVSPQVTGSIVSVNVTDNQIVKNRRSAGDDRPAKLQSRGRSGRRANPAERSDDQKTSMPRSRRRRPRSIRPTQQVTEAQAALKFSTDENTRYQDLVQKGAGTVQRAQQASSDFNGKQAALDAPNAAKVSAERQIDVLNAQKVGAAAQLDQAKAQKDRADADLQRTELRATVDGRVTKLTAAVGALAAPGQSIMVVVPLDIWVTANFKESQLADMRVGQPVDIEIDAFGTHLPRPGQQRSGRQRHRVQSAARRKRHRQLCEGGAARAGEDHLRPAPRRRTRDRACRSCRPSPSVPDGWPMPDAQTQRPRANTVTPIPGSSPSWSRSRPSWRCSTPPSPTSRCVTSPGGLAVSSDEASWVITTYLVANSIVLCASGWIARDVRAQEFLSGLHRAVHGEFAAVRLCVESAGRCWCSA